MCYEFKPRGPRSKENEKSKENMGCSINGDWTRGRAAPAPSCHAKRVLKEPPETVLMALTGAGFAAGGTMGTDGLALPRWIS